MSTINEETLSVNEAKSNESASVTRSSNPSGCIARIVQETCNNSCTNSCSSTDTITCAKSSPSETVQKTDETTNTIISESSLTTPWDRDLTNKWKPNQFVEPLTLSELKEATEELTDKAFINKFPKVDRTYADPPINHQRYGLISFVPSKGSKPDEHGVYGFAKVRGVYDTEIETEQRSEYIIKNVDSFHKMHYFYVGRPFPITLSSKYSAEVSEIDIRKQTTDAISTSIKRKTQEDKKEMDEINEREAKLKQDHHRALNDIPEDDYETYITLRVKKAQLIWTYLEHQKKQAEIKEILIKTRKDIEALDGKFPDYQNSYFDKYKEARVKAGLKESDEDTQSNFMKFLIEDVNLGF